MKKILASILTLTLCLGLTAGCGSQSDDTAEDDQTPSGTAVEVTEVTQGAMSTEYSVNGKVAADNEVQVFPMLAGQVLTLSVSEGDKVSKGQTLLSVDTSTVTSTMSSLRESYNATKTATDKAIVEYIEGEITALWHAHRISEPAQGLFPGDMRLMSLAEQAFFPGEGASFSGTDWITGDADAQYVITLQNGEMVYTGKISQDLVDQDGNRTGIVWQDIAPITLLA